MVARIVMAPSGINTPQESPVVACSAVSALVVASRKVCRGVVVLKARCVGRRARRRSVGGIVGGVEVRWWGVVGVWRLCGW